LVSFETKYVSPPSEVYVTVNDAIVLCCWNSAVGAELVVHWRILRADGEIIRETQVVTPTSDRSFNSFQWSVPEGFLLSLHVSPTGVEVKRGQMWVIVGIGSPPGNLVTYYQLLLADYTESGGDLGWPGGRIQSSVEGPGYLTTALINPPAAGQPIIVQPPTNARWRFIGAVFTLTTDAVAGNRDVSVTFGSTGVSAMQQWAATTQPASTTYVYSLGQYYFAPVDRTPNQVAIGMPAGIDLTSTIFARIFGYNIDPADQFGGANILVEEWIDP
jgi:hypothetical protein